MKKIGHRVSLLSVSEEDPRNGEGTFITSKDSSIIYAYSHFYGEGSHDHASANIFAIRSYDDGESWSEPYLLLAKDENASNYMCPSFMRMANGDMGLFYLRKYKISDKDDIIAEVCLVRSSNEGKTWSQPISCTSGDIYYVFENDHAIMLEHSEYAGRIILPVNIHSHIVDGVIKETGIGVACFFASDDDGVTWYKLAGDYEICNAPYSTTGLQETMIYEQNDGTLRAISRTDMHCHYESFSYDGGKTWTDNHPVPYFSAPASPLLMRRAATLTCAVFNPTPNYTTRSGPEMRLWGGRTPLVMAISDNDGKSFKQVYAIEDEKSDTYCYTAMYDGGDYILLGYYHSNGTDSIFGANVITKASKNELLS